VLVGIDGLLLVVVIGGGSLVGPVDCAIPGQVDDALSTWKPYNDKNFHRV
jgi:hypothetical protein